MFLGVLQFELSIPHARSLKDKRRVVKSIKDRLHRQHLVSVAEAAMHEDARTAVLSVALVSSSKGHISSTLDRIMDKLAALADARLADHQRDVFRPHDLPEEFAVNEDSRSDSTRASA